MALFFFLFFWKVSIYLLPKKKGKYMFKEGIPSFTRGEDLKQDKSKS